MPPATPTTITSQNQLNQTLKSHTHTLADFHASWCGPCKTIAPIYDQLCSAHAKPRRLAFVKIDVDANGDITSKYGVSAMPTFLLFKGEKVVETIRGADAGALRSAVAKAEREVGGAGGGFGGGGRRLGGAEGEGASGGLGSADLKDWVWGMSRGRWVETVVRFLGLYVTSLFSFDAMAAAESSPFAVGRRR